MRSSAVVALCAFASCVRPPAPAPAPASTPAPAPGPESGPEPEPAAACADLRAIDEHEALVASSDDPSSPDPFSEQRVRRAASACSVADDNLAALERSILGAPLPAGPAPVTPRWDHRTPPLRLDLIDRRLTLTPDERRLLTKNGFVVSPRTELPSFGYALHEIYQSQLPVFVSVDAIFQAVFAGNDKAILRLEQGRLEPMLGQALAMLACALPGAAPDYPPEVARDVDVYLTVARALLSGDRDTRSALGTESEVARVLEVLDEERDLAGTPDDPRGPFVLFGRPRVVDVSAYRPRGHYASPAFGLERYFRAATWLSRLELNLSSRSCRSSHPDAVPDPSETPREAVVALALADLAERSRAMPLLEKLDRAWGLLAGRREDLSLGDLAGLRREARIASLRDPAAPGALRAAIGDRWKRTARTHFMPEGSTELPAIATVLGARIGPDASATRGLVHDQVPGRYVVSGVDLAHVLGNRRAKTYLAADLAAFPTLGPALDRAREDARRQRPGDDLYGAWLGAIRALSDEPPVAAPSFMQTDAFRDLRLDSTIAAFGQLRHNYVLMAAGTYDSYGCEIPDGWVEPAPAAFAALVGYADRGRAALRQLDPEDASHVGAYFERVGTVLRVLSKIVARESAGEPLDPLEKRFLGMVAEYVPRAEGCFDSCEPPTYSGWWFDLYLDRIADGLADPRFIADYYASTSTRQVAYVGASTPRLGVFVVDTGGPPRAFVGPVARAWDRVAPLDRRLTDEDARELAAPESPWAASYTAKAPATVPLVVDAVEQPGRRAPRGALVLEAKSPRALEAVRIELLDHHRAPIVAATHAVGPSPVLFRFDAPRSAEGLRVRVGAFSATTLHGFSLDTTTAGTSGQVERPAGEAAP